ncbi:STE3-domain-containing protein [Cytidiella melzeri]|nr:STE3-domain-containing protein [Cytidiella melzeri]
MNFIVAFLVSIPLYWHLEAWNVGCVLYIGWIVVSCLISGINGCIWRDNAINWAPIWGDITVHIQFAASQGLLAAAMVIARRLNRIASTSSVSNSRSDKRRALMIDLALGLLPPIIYMACMWVVQGHRFDIYEGLGPIGAVPNTWVYTVFAHGSNLLIGLTSATYSIMTLRIFLRRRKQFNELLASNSNISFNRYMRLMALCCVEVMVTVPLIIYLIVYETTVLPEYKFIGMADLHYGFSRVVLFPEIIWLMSPHAVSRLTMQQWLTITCGLVFFTFFGLAEEARTHYRLAFTTIAKKLGYSTAGSSLESSTGFPSKGSKLGVTIPSFIQRSTNRRSISSFSDKLSVGDFDTFEDIEKKAYSPTETASCSSDSVQTPIDGVRVHQHQEVKVDFPEAVHLPGESARPDSGVVVVESNTRWHSPEPDVPSSVRDSAHMV